MSHVTSVHLAHDLPHYAGDGAGREKVGRRCWRAEELGQGKEEKNGVRLVSDVSSIRWDYISPEEQKKRLFTKVVQE